MKTCSKCSDVGDDDVDERQDTPVGGGGVLYSRAFFFFFSFKKKRKQKRSARKYNVKLRLMFAEEKRKEKKRLVPVRCVSMLRGAEDCLKSKCFRRFLRISHLDLAVL